MQEGLAWIHLRTPPPPPEHLVVLQTLQCFSEAHAVFGHQVGPDQCGPHHQLPTDKAAADQARSICHGGAAIGAEGDKVKSRFSPPGASSCADNSNGGARNCTSYPDPDPILVN